MLVAWCGFPVALWYLCVCSGLVSDVFGLHVQPHPKSKRTFENPFYVPRSASHPTTAGNGSGSGHGARDGSGVDDMQMQRSNSNREEGELASYHTDQRDDMLPPSSWDTRDASTGSLTIPSGDAAPHAGAAGHERPRFPPVNTPR